MDIPDLIDAVETEGTRLGGAAISADLDADVPGCPGWTVRDVVTHVAGVHRWAADSITRAITDGNGAMGSLVGSGPSDAELLDWYDDGLNAVVHALRAAPADLECFTFLPASSPLTFWARRQAHETTIHRVDVESAAGPITPPGGALSEDGIDELLFGFGSRPRRPLAPGRLQLTTGDTSWVASFGDHGLAISSYDEETSPPDAVVSATPDQLYLWLWNRPAEVKISGDPIVAEQWHAIRVRWS